MDKKRIFAAISASAVLIASCGIVNASADDTEANSITLVSAQNVMSGVCGDDITWSFDSATGTLTLDGSGSTDVFNWEADAENSRKRIYYTPWKDLNDDIKNIVIGEKVTEICAGAFYGCSALENVELKNNDAVIGSDVFRYTPYYENNAVEYDGIYYLNDRVVGVSEEVKDTITSLDVRQGTIGIATTDIRNCPNLSKITLPEGFKHLPNGTFYNMRSLKEVELPESISFIEDWALCNTGISKLTIKNPDCYIANFTSTICNNYDPETGAAVYNGVIYGYDGSAAQKYAFYSCYAFGSIGESPDPKAHKDASGMCGNDTRWRFDSKTGTLTLSGTGLMDFYAEAHLAFVDEGYQIIDTPWLDLRGYIRSVVVEDGITYLPYGLFAHYFALENVVLPEDLVYSSEDFNFTPYFNNNAEADGDIFYLNDCLSGFDYTVKDSITRIDVRPGTKTIAKTLRELSNLSEINIPEGVRFIPNGAFCSLTKLETVVLPESVDLIDAWAFYTPGLKRLTITNPECRIIEDESDATICNEIDPETNERIYKGVICGYAGSTAQKYAEKYGYAFEELEVEDVSVPANVKVGKNGKVTWNASENADYYRVKKIANGTAYYSNKITDTSYTLNKIPTTDYKVAVVAYGKGGVSAKSKAVSVKADPILGYVNSVTVDEDGNVSWEAAKGAVAYRVAKVVNGKTYYGAKTEDTSYKLAGVPNKDYHVFVIAYDADGRSSWGKKALVKVGELGVVFNTKADKYGNITWDAARNAVYYRVFKIVNGKTYVGAKTEGTSYKLAGVPKSDYRVYVAAYDNNGSKVTGAKIDVKKTAPVFP